MIESLDSKIFFVLTVKICRPVKIIVEQKCDVKMTDGLVLVFSRMSNCT